MATASAVLDTALGFLGTREYPSGSNNVIFNTHYYGKAVYGSAFPWCCAFVWDVFRLSNASDLFFGGARTAYCPTAYNDFRAKGQLVDRPLPGDVVFYAFNGSRIPNHIGIVYSVGSDSIIAIEGNTSVTSDDNGGNVMKRTRKFSSCFAFARPAYEPEYSAEPSKIPKWVGVVTASLLNVRRGPGTEYANLTIWPHLAYGNYIDVCDSVGDWYFVRIQAMYYGYVSARYIRRVL